ncbi:hypothetical protein FHG87_013900 [Trinorchestia longiramus]|nr:hypothetical protein FHG87_013900 [Trinorchestia longiramus]
MFNYTVKRSILTPTPQIRALRSIKGVQQVSLTHLTAAYPVSWSCLCASALPHHPLRHDRRTNTELRGAAAGPRCRRTPRLLQTQRPGRAGVSPETRSPDPADPERCGRVSGPSFQSRVVVSCVSGA